MDFSNSKELQKHAMKARYGWLRFFKFGHVDRNIKRDVRETMNQIQRPMGEFDEHQARLDFVRKYPIKD